MTYGDLLSASAAGHPQRVALIAGTRKITYREVDQWSRRLAGWLLGQAQPGERVALHMSNSLEMAILLVACLRSGAIAVPLPTRLIPAEIEGALASSGCSLYFGEAVPYLAVEPVRASAGVRVRDYFVCGAFGELPGVLPFPNLSDPEADGPAPRVELDQPALILSTRGATARPARGVVHSQRTLAAAVERMRALGQAGEVVILMASLAEAGGLTGGLLPALAQAATVVLAPVFHADLALDLVERHGVTWAAASPGQWQKLERAQREERRDLGSLKFCAACGDPLPAALAESLREITGQAPYEGYGLAESLPVCWNLPGQSRPGSLGRALPGVEARVIDEAGAPLASGHTGELAVRSAANFTGYWNDPRGTAAALRDGWLLTGDLARADAEAYFWFAGRKPAPRIPSEEAS